MGRVREAVRTTWTCVCTLVRLVPCMSAVLTTGSSVDSESFRFVPAAVVVLESLNSALQKQESLAANEKVSWSHFSQVDPGLLVTALSCQSPSPTTERKSSTGEQDHLRPSPTEDRKQSCKRKRTPVEADSEEDLDIDGRSATLYLLLSMSWLMLIQIISSLPPSDLQQEDKIKITVRAEDHLIWSPVNQLQGHRCKPCRSCICISRQLC